MRKFKQIVAIAAVSVAPMIVASSLYARDGHGSSMMQGGMMGSSHMTGRTSRMMDHCSTMMQGDSRDGRPNDQWRKRSPAAPDKQG